MLPQTEFHHKPDNPASLIFTGRIKIENTASYYYFEEGGKVQNLLHRIKYNGMKEAAKVIGLWYGEALRNSHFSDADLVIPVPLHASKLRKRGYNQSEWFAKGIAESMGIPLDAKSFIKTRKTESQTKKTRLQRQANVAESFTVVNIPALANKHILLVDEVITTGATLEACAQTLLALNCGIKISIVSIALAT